MMKVSNIHHCPSCHRENRGSEPCDECQGTTTSTSSIGYLFDALLASLAEHDATAPQELVLSDLIVRERSEQVDLLFDLLEQSLAHPDKIDQPSFGVQYHRQNDPAEPRLLHTSPELAHASEIVANLPSQSSASATVAEPRIPKTIPVRLKTAHLQARLTATATDLTVTIFLLATVLALTGASVPLVKPELIALPDATFSTILFLALLGPTFCLCRTVSLLLWGTTPGFLVSGTRLVTNQKALPLRRYLFIYALTSPIIALCALGGRSLRERWKILGLRIVSENDESSESET